jgi:hypothetical protein
MPINLIDQRLRFPDPRRADEEGLVAVGGDLSAPRLLLAYRSGIFPWTAEPVTWWSPDPRGVFELDGFHVSRSLARVLRQAPFEIRLDSAFKEVMAGCAEPARVRSRWRPCHPGRSCRELRLRSAKRGARAHLGPPLAHAVARAWIR